MKTITEQIIDAYDELDELLSRPSISDHALELIDKLRPKINSLIHQYREKRKWVNVYKCNKEGFYPGTRLLSLFDSKSSEEAQKDIDSKENYIETIEIIRPWVNQNK